MPSKSNLKNENKIHQLIGPWDIKFGQAGICRIFTTLNRISGQNLLITSPNELGTEWNRPPDHSVMLFGLLSCYNF